MRKIYDMQLKFGQTPIGQIQFDPHSRDEIPKLLRGFQGIWCDRKTRDQIFKCLSELIPSNINPKNGRKGMDLWKIFVLGSLRLNSNWDYDKLLEIANHHDILRQILGHGTMDADYRYALQTLKDNIALFTPEILDKTNQIVIGYGHEIVGKKPEDPLNGSCDSFVGKTDAHFPTDISLLFDAVRKIISIIMIICTHIDISEWRQGKHLIRKAKSFYREAQQLKRSSSKDNAKKAERERLIICAHEAYIVPERKPRFSVLQDQKFSEIPLSLRGIC